MSVGADVFLGWIHTDRHTKLLYQGHKVQNVTDVSVPCLRKSAVVLLSLF